MRALLYIFCNIRAPKNLTLDCWYQTSGTERWKNILIWRKKLEKLWIYQSSFLGLLFFLISEGVTFNNVFKMLVFNELYSEKKKNWYTFGTWVYFNLRKPIHFRCLFVNAFCVTCMRHSWVRLWIFSTMTLIMKYAWFLAVPQHVINDIY